MRKTGEIPENPVVSTYCQKSEEMIQCSFIYNERPVLVFVAIRVFWNTTEIEKWTMSNKFLAFHASV
jgi:hypothetical protein